VTSTTIPEHLDDTNAAATDAQREPQGGGETGDRVAVRTYVLDTSVLLSDPRAMFRFEEHEVVIPIVATTPRSATSPASRCDCSTSFALSMGGSTCRCRSASRAARSASS
jgi:hypothetical protein